MPDAPIERAEDIRMRQSNFGPPQNADSRSETNDNHSLHIINPSLSCICFQFQIYNHKISKNDNLSCKLQLNVYPSHGN